MAVYLTPGFGAGYQGFLPTGLPNVSGKIFTYLAGTSTPTATYTTSAGSVANTNPIILGPSGYIPNEIWQSGGQAIKIVVQDALGNPISTNDNLTGIGDPASIGNVVSQIVAGSNIVVSPGGGTGIVTVSAPSVAIPYGVDSGSVNSVSLTLTGIVAYTDGMIVAGRVGFNNTGASTLNINGLGAKAIINQNNCQLLPGEMSAGIPYIFIYSSAGSTGFSLVGGTDKEIPVSAFAADNTGVVDATSAINSAITAAAIVGGTVRFNSGTYKISGAGLSLNQSAITSGFASNGRVTLRGSSDGNTKISYPVASGTNTAFTFTGTSTAYSGATYGWYTRFAIEDIHLDGPGNTSTNNGFQFTLAATFSLRNVTVSNFAVGMTCTDCIGALFDNCNFMFNASGFYCSAGAAAVSPNALTFRQCAVMYNTNLGGHVVSPVGFSMYGGYVQNNGNTGSATFKYGLYIDSTANTAGQGVGANIDGVWFESNGDGTGNSWADLLFWSTSGGSGANTVAVTVKGCTFQRSEPASDGHNYYCTNCIQWDTSTSTKASLALIGNTFQAFNTYVSSSSRPYVAISMSSTGKNEFVEFGNLYADPINAGTSEKPTWVTTAGTAPTIQGMLRNKAAMSTSWGNFTGSAGGITINQAFNVSSAVRNAAGNYTINFAQGLGNSPCGTITPISTAGYAYFSGATTNSVTIICNNTADTATDMAFALVMFGGDMVA